MYLSNNIGYNTPYVIRLKDETIFFKHISLCIKLIINKKIILLLIELF